MAFSAPGESSFSIIPGCLSRPHVVNSWVEVEALSQVPVSVRRPGVAALGRHLLFLGIVAVAPLLGGLVQLLHQASEVDQTLFFALNAGKLFLLLHKPQGIL